MLFCNTQKNTSQHKFIYLDFRSALLRRRRMREEDLKQDTEIFGENISALSSFDCTDLLRESLLSLRVEFRGEFHRQKTNRNSRWSFFDH